jgi:hypothetical protein
MRLVGRAVIGLRVLVGWMLVHVLACLRIARA